jgi:hypothetical protein
MTTMGDAGIVLLLEENTEDEAIDRVVECIIYRGMFYH